ncbi:nuclear protein involved in pre-rRNA processing [Drechmeria coniospora]|uniref:rRNA-processing protein EFG1 n=1 Tax=Drechmeria coniospora TaxID=98403 RepID=A0A151GKZ9_DRECN|nr:nuclear protein involved in pre-rRNA processing [Drechmeria coniospora]KYK57794.1 nuclear protein involved in pre-rRNA processing [Drechmeria coniospora]
MGTKRSIVDVESQEGGDTPADNPGFANKRRKHFGTGKHKAKEGSSEFAKKRVRNIQRLLQRNQDLPANVRNDLERELAAHVADIGDKTFQRKRSAMISKYHMVRFFGISRPTTDRLRSLTRTCCRITDRRAERKKASRLAKQLRRQIDNAPDGEDVEKLKQQLHIAEVDEAYTLYHPHAESYISLYGNIKSEAEGEEIASKKPVAKMALEGSRPPMWSVVETTMEEGQEALKRLRERRSAEDTAKGGDDKLKRQAPRSSASKPKEDTKKQRQLPQKHDEGRKHHGNKEGQAGGKTGKTGETGEMPGLNRRERRRLMREKAIKDDSDDGDGGFFEEG